MNQRKIIVLLLGLFIMLSGYRNIQQKGPLYAPFINNKWEFYAIGDSLGRVAYHYESTTKYNPPVYIYFKEDKKIAVYTKTGFIIGYYYVVDTSLVGFIMGDEKNRMSTWAECLRRHGRSDRTKQNRYSYNDSNLLIHFTINGSDSTFIFNKIK